MALHFAPSREQKPCIDSVREQIPRYHFPYRYSVSMGPSHVKQPPTRLTVRFFPGICLPTRKSSICVSKSVLQHLERASKFDETAQRSNEKQGVVGVTDSGLGDGGARGGCNRRGGKNRFEVGLRVVVYRKARWSRRRGSVGVIPGGQGCGAADSVGRIVLLDFLTAASWPRRGEK